MKSKGFVIVLFAVIVGIQWFVPLQMLQDRRSTLSSGKIYKFKMAPMDPEDPFRGKYLDLRFEEDQIKVGPETQWQAGESVYVILQKDSLGFAQITNLSNDKPGSEKDYIKTTIGYVDGGESLTAHIDYPFDRYYINERMAGPLEKILTENQRDTSKVNYAQVRIRSGQAILEEVFIDERSVPEWYEKVK